MELWNRRCEAAPPPTPLTLEELREMDGEPVWVNLCLSSCWAIVHKGRAVFGDGDAIPLERFAGRAYRRKLDEGTI